MGSYPHRSPSKLGWQTVENKAIVAPNVEAQARATQSTIDKSLDIGHGTVRQFGECPVSCSPSAGIRKTKAKAKRKSHQEPDRPATVFVCVYRQFVPEKNQLRDCVAKAAEGDPQLQYLYDQLMTGQTVYDWGDDPSFFSAEYVQGAAESAAWGVCRPNVRRMVRRGDSVVFFCARRARKFDPIHYLFTGYGTVARTVKKRQDVWRKAELQPYQNHFNVLAKPGQLGRLKNAERFPPIHEDWAERVKSPYVIFDPELSRFDMEQPTMVAYAEPGSKVETWYKTPSAQAIWDTIFGGFELQRSLRVSAKGSSHPHINLTKNLASVGMTAAQLIEKLRPLVRDENTRTI
jgi:hypothetical protein